MLGGRARISRFETQVGRLVATSKRKPSPKRGQVKGYLWCPCAKLRHLPCQISISQPSSNSRDETSTPAGADGRLWSKVGQRGNVGARAKHQVGAVVKTCMGTRAAPALGTSPGTDGGQNALLRSGNLGKQRGKVSCRSKRLRTNAAAQGLQMQTPGKLAMVCQ